MRTQKKASLFPGRREMEGLSAHDFTSSFTAKEVENNPRLFPNTIQEETSSGFRLQSYSLAFPIDMFRVAL